MILTIFLNKFIIKLNTEFIYYLIRQYIIIKNEKN
jgi:hypothetical protein